MKNTFTMPKLEISHFSFESVITTSGETPTIPSLSAMQKAENSVGMQQADKVYKLVW